MATVLNFKEGDLLNSNDFDLICFSPSPRKKAEIIATVLKKYIFIKNGSIFILQDNFIYFEIKEKSEIESCLWDNTSKLLENSFNNFNNNTANILRDHLHDCKQSLMNVYSKNNILKYLDPLRTELKKDIKLDSYTGQLHYLNGYIDIKTNTFLKRDGLQYITKCINREYKKSTKKQKELFIKKYIHPIYPNEDDRECMIGIIGSALTGQSTKEQDMLFNIGEGSAGKSISMEITKASLTIYFKELKSDIFSTSSAEKNKLLNSYQDDPQILITWINEFSGERVDSPLFKSFIEGKCSTTRLYHDGACEFNHKSKIIGTSNGMPNIIIDSGTKRRIKAFTHKSKFVDDIKDVNEEKNIYLKNKSLLDDIISHQLLDTWIDILVEKANNYMNGSILKYSKNFEETKDLVIDSNDYIKDFIDSKLTILKKDDLEYISSRIGKREMHMLFCDMYPNKHLKELDIIVSLKSKNIEYNKDFRCPKDHVRGCFMGVKIQVTRTSESSDHKMFNRKKSYQELETENLILKEKLENLQKEFNQHKQPTQKIFKKITTKDKFNEEYQQQTKEFNDLYTKIDKLKEPKKQLQKRKIVKRKIFNDDEKTREDNEIKLTRLLLG